MPRQAASTCSATHSGLPPFTCRAARMSGVRSGAEWTMNHGSTAMQWPPTPGPGCRMSTRGWRLASPMSSQGSTPRESHTSETSFANAMFTSRYAFSVSFTSSAVRAPVTWHRPRTNTR